VSELVLLPGLDGTGRLFTSLIAALPPGIHATVIPYPANQPLDLAQLAALVQRELPAGRPVLLAESFSGLVALALLASASARIRGVIFVGAFAEPPRPFLLRLAPLVSRSKALLRSTPSFLLRQYCLGTEASAADLNALRQIISAVSPQVLSQRLALAGARHSFGKGRIDVPCFYLRANQDRLVPASCATWFQERFRNCAIEEIDGPHFMLQARPRQSAQAIARMLALLAS
jgi:pimeloyl-[acyl-carrier protein] methyl ester esterase